MLQQRTIAPPETTALLDRQSRTKTDEDKYGGPRARGADRLGQPSRDGTEGRSGSGAVLPELLDEAAREPLQAEVPTVRVLSELLGFLLSAEGDSRRPKPRTILNLEVGGVSETAVPSSVYNGWSSLEIIVRRTSCNARAALFGRVG